MTFGPFFICEIEHYWSTVIYNPAHCVCLVFCVWLCGLVVLLVLGDGCVSGWVCSCVGCLCLSPWLCGVVVLCLVVISTWEYPAAELLHWASVFSECCCMWRLAVCPDSLLPSLPETTPLMSSDSPAPTGDQQEHTSRTTTPDVTMDGHDDDQSLDALAYRSGTGQLDIEMGPVQTLPKDRNRIL